MTELSEFAQRTLAELDEAGEENLPTLLNTILIPTGESNEFLGLRDAISSLLQENLVRIAFERDQSLRLKDISFEDSLSVVEHLSEHLIYNPEVRHWTGGQRPWPHVVSTERGKQRGNEILSVRGYQWWRQRD